MSSDRPDILVASIVSFVIGFFAMLGEISFRNWGVDPVALLAALLLGAPLVACLVFLPVLGVVTVFFDTFFPED